MASSTPASKLRELLRNEDCFLLCPGVYNGFSARVALGVGFDCLYLTGAGATASMHGQADLAISTLNDMRFHAEMISQLDPSTPVIADADTGFGGPIMVARTVTQYARSGVAALHIEDQIQTKRWVHLGGKVVEDTETYTARVRAAVQARKRIGSDIVIIARTDALQPYGYEDALARLTAARDAGADMGFLEGVTSKEMASQVVNDLKPWPMLLNMVEHGATPIISSEEATSMGFKVMIVPFAALAPAYSAIKPRTAS